MPARTFLPLLAALLALGGCLQSADPLIADSAHGDAFAGIYEYRELDYGADGRVREGAPTLVKLERDGDRIAQRDHDRASGRWIEGVHAYRFAPWRDRPGEAIVQADGTGHAYLFYRAQGDGGLLWNIDCSRLSQAVREELELTLDGQDCTVRGIEQLRAAIGAYMATDPRPDYRIVRRGRTASDRMVLGIEDEADAGGAMIGSEPRNESTAERIRRMTGLSVDMAGETQTAEKGDGALATLAAPFGRAWAALGRGDWGALWQAIARSWLIFALLGGVAALVLTRILRRRR